MTTEQITPGLKIKMQLVAETVLGQENKIVTREIETVNNGVVTFKGSKAKYKANSGWMKPIANITHFTGKLNYRVVNV